MEWVGWLGFSLLVISWVPQTWQTVQRGSTDMHMAFLLLYTFSSYLLTWYSWMIDDLIFILLNGLLAVGGTINLYYKLWPRN